MRGHDLLAVRLNRRSTGLERLLGLVRNQYSEIPEISLGSDGDGCVNVLLPLAGCRIPVGRIVQELRALHDVLEVRGFCSAEVVVRQLALAQVSRIGTLAAEMAARVVAHGNHAPVLELTGSPKEIDEALGKLRSVGVLLGARRAGPILLDLDPSAASVDQ